MADLARIRNFCVIAHVDHGKTTLSDRLLEMTGTVPLREMREQLLDSMVLEREHGITIKARAVRMAWRDHELNLIDTPGHVDFTYEVSRSLAACEGAVLLVDASQGIEAQTLANAYLAVEQGLEVIPVINKIDLPNIDLDVVREELRMTLGFRDDEILLVSGKTGAGVEELLNAIVERVPAPTGDVSAPLGALIFDSHYDAYKGVVAHIRVVDGALAAGDRIRLMATERESDLLELGVFVPDARPIERLATGEVGYVATGLKAVADCRVGDTLTLAARPAVKALPGYRPAKPMVFAGFYPTNAEDYPALKDALEKLRLNDASLIYEPETSQALGFGFRAGFLGLLHLEIVQERLEREYDVELIATSPSVEYRVITQKGAEVAIDNPALLPDPGTILEIREPWMSVTVIVPTTHVGAVMEVAQNKRASLLDMSYVDPTRAMLKYQMPLSELIVDFYDQLKSRSQGYASLDYEFAEYRAADLVRLDILVSGSLVDALSIITHRDRAQQSGRVLVSKLRGLIPKQMFDVRIQAAIGGKVIASETVKAKRKDVLAKCYGGDITRKRKLLEKQKEGKKRMKMVGSVEIPQEAFLAVLRMGDET
ncbi:MAG TPA: translation elongation factor 4 [Candidatus Limnocylindria bacterium]|jgi:GTP-binding protein LepA|nr:translation elongation factor 4 [Candidatus Limnocylindria bacterium]